MSVNIPSRSIAFLEEEDRRGYRLPLVPESLLPQRPLTFEDSTASPQPVMKRRNDFVTPLRASQTVGFEQSETYSSTSSSEEEKDEALTADDSAREKAIAMMEELEGLNVELAALQATTVQQTPNPKPQQDTDSPADCLTRNNSSRRLAQFAKTAH